MNKKLLTICLVVALILSAVCFVGCKDKTADKLREVNTALVRDYSKVELAVTTRNGNLELKAKYVITKSDGMTDISYEVDRLNAFDVNGDIPSEFKSTVKGNAKFNGSSIVSIDGETLDEQVLLDVKDMTMSFRLSLLDEIQVSQNGLSAKVTNPKGFLKNDNFAGKDMTVKVTMAESYLTDIVLEYVLDGATVKLVYAFTR